MTAAWRALGAALAWTGSFVATAAPELSGQVRPEVTIQQASLRGPIAQAAALDPGIVTPPASGVAVETELRAAGHGLTGVGTLRLERLEGDRFRGHALANELYASGSVANWQLAAGKKIVAWDVGYGFRPNDFVEQETRRQLLTTTAEGRPLLMAEHFDASTAWSFVAVNPTHARDRRGAEEPALAARVYQRDGGVDWHGFARWGVRTRGSVGAAAAWVASDALELHASLRALDAADTVAIDPQVSGLVARNPWRDASVHRTAQALVGGTWTNADQLSLLGEAWFDGTAPASGCWDAWNARNRQLASLAATPAPVAAIAGNLAWQASAFGASSNLRRANLFGRVSWTHEHWEPALDMLFTPADAGRIVTASLGWQGDRVRVDVGWRVYGGPTTAILAQVPARSIAYAAWTSFF